MSEWRSIESAPKDGQPLLCAKFEGLDASMGLALWMNEGWHFLGCKCAWKGPRQPTHWMPLPAPPQS